MAELRPWLYESATGSLKTVCGRHPARTRRFAVLRKNGRMHQRTPVVA